MKHKEELIAAIKSCGLYMLLFAFMLFGGSLLRGEAIMNFGLRIIMLLVGIAVVVYLRYISFINAKRNAELGADNAYTPAYIKKYMAAKDAKTEAQAEAEDDIPEEKE